MRPDVAPGRQWIGLGRAGNGRAGDQAPTNDHDLGLFSVGEGAIDSPAGNGGVGIYHLAWEVDTLDELVGHWSGERNH
ncbi:MAG TPA: hypothetical protein VMO88_09215 [Acidimicrobiales bacterium]|nr:hypothetical protein [Acidimicrobiales bacterium]